jgi:hypothetical protein
VPILLIVGWRRENHDMENDLHQWCYLMSAPRKKMYHSILVQSQKVKKRLGKCLIKDNDPKLSAGNTLLKKRKLV